MMRAVLLCGTPLLFMTYCLWRNGARPLAAPFDCVAQLVAITAVAAFVQYPIAAIGRPLIDANLAGIDRALGFDWPACFAWVLRHPMALRIFGTVYLSFLPQSFLVGIVAWFQPDRASIVLAANALTLTCCFVVFALWPAGGAFEYYHPGGIVSGYVEQFMATRAGLVTSLSFGHMQGIIQFPSYHAAGAVLLGYAFAGLPVWIAIPAFVIEFTLAASAVLVGGHHLVDVLAGVAVAAASLALARQALRYRGVALGERPLDGVSSMSRHIKSAMNQFRRCFAR